MPFVACDNGAHTHTDTRTQTEARLRYTHARTWSTPIEVWTTRNLPLLLQFSATHCIHFAVYRSCVAPVDLISHTRLGSPGVQVTPRGECVICVWAGVSLCVCVYVCENKQKLSLRIYHNAHVVCHIVNQVNQAVNNAHCDNNNSAQKQHPHQCLSTHSHTTNTQYDTYTVPVVRLLCVGYKLPCLSRCCYCCKRSAV